MPQVKHKKTVILLSKFLLAVLLLSCIALFLAYIVEPDFCAALTFWPVWIWAIFGIALTLFSVGTNKKLRFFVIIIWLLLIGLTAEEPLALLRSFTLYSRECKSSCPSGNCLRVISLNCASSNIIAAEDLVKYNPDIVLLQENPGNKELETLTRKLFGSNGGFVLEGDTSILARGRVTKTEVGKENHFFMATARVFLPSGIEIETISIHLSSPASGVNIFSRSCWQEHCEDRKQRIQKIRDIKEHLDSVPADIPLVIGGDFNAKPWRAMRKLFSPRLNDSFIQSGVGWPGTGPSHFPLWRVDQIWISKQFKAVKVRSEKNDNSDHRMVICDLCKL